MAKDFLAFLGLIFLTILILVSVGLIVYFFDAFGMVSLPDDLLAWVGRFGAVVEEAPPVDRVEWSNPLDTLPTATMPPFMTSTPVPTLTPSLIPALAPAVYRSEVTGRMKQFVTALENWRDLNNRLVKESQLASDPEWLQEMTVSLEVVVITGSALASAGPPPPEYAGIDAWLDRVPPEAEGLKRTYLEALQTSDTQAFLAAGDHFARIKEALAGAVNEMLVQGWTIE